MTSLDRFLLAMARRLRLVWAWATAALIAPVLAGVALLLVMVGRLRPWSWPEPVALALVLASAAVVVVWAMVQRLPTMAVARAADRGLRTADGFGAALQFRDVPGPFAEPIRLRAEALADAARPSEAAPMPPRGRRWAVAAGIAVAALGLALADNPQDDVRAEQAETQRLIDTAAETLEEEVEILAEDPRTQEVAEQLAALAEQLREADDLAAAQALLAEAQELLDESRPQDFAAKQAATAGLERGLAERPLVPEGAGASAARAADRRSRDVGRDVGRRTTSLGRATRRPRQDPGGGQPRAWARRWLMRRRRWPPPTSRRRRPPWVRRRWRRTQRWARSATSRPLTRRQPR